MIQVVQDAVGDRIAVIVRSGYHKPGIGFLTEPESDMQLGYIGYPAGHTIEPHVHNNIPRSVTTSQEVLIIRRGVMMVDLYDDDRSWVCRESLGPGDVILLVRGGHGFTVIEDVEMFEVKQGPYAGISDKVRFIPETNP